MGFANLKARFGQSVIFMTLRDLNYLKFLSGSVIASCGDRINQVALLSLVIHVTGDVAKHSANIMFWTIAPAVLLGPFNVALIDRLNRQKTMIVSDLARAILIASLPILMVYIKHYYLIYGMVFLIGTFGAVFTPCRLAILPNLVPRNLLMSANAISSQAINIATVGAAPLGALLVSKLGHDAGFIVNAITYLCSAYFIWNLRPISKLEPVDLSKTEVHPLNDLRQGLSYIQNTKPVFFYVVFTGITNCFIAIFLITFVEYGVQILKQEVIGTVFLFLAMAFGMVLGALWLGRYTRLSERFNWPMWMLTLTGVGMFLMSKVHDVWFAAAILIYIGFCGIMVLVPLDTFLQKNVPDEYRGRVFAVRGVFVGCAFLASLQFSKGILHQLMTLPTFKWLGIAVVLFGLASLRAEAWIKKRSA
jgi:MFS transporter, DHA3 family, macrolide efflux protein